MRLISWNLNQRRSGWDRLTELADEYSIDAALVQEARRPASLPDVFRTEPAVDDSDRWRVPVPRANRAYCSAIVCLNPDVVFTPYAPTPLVDAAYGQLTISHPGQFAVARLGDSSGIDLIVISMYGLWDRVSSAGDIYACASLHRAISDLSCVLFDTQAPPIVLAGDLNVWRDYGSPAWRPRYDSVFDRLTSAGLAYAGPTRDDAEPPLLGCPCNSGDRCRHVDTFRYRAAPTAIPYQNDHVLLSRTLAGRARVWCVPGDDVWLHSDHRPVLIDL